MARTAAACAVQVVVPKTYTEYTSRRVLTTSWLEGEKLSGSTASDVGDLVNLGVICYLKQLLDTGFFHVRHTSAACRLVSVPGPTAASRHTSSSPAAKHCKLAVLTGMCNFDSILSDSSESSKVMRVAQYHA